MQERLLAAEARGGDEAVAKLGEAVLYFGCRRRDQDYLYGALLERWAAEGKLTLFTAFSRQQVHVLPQSLIFYQALGATEHSDAAGVDLGYVLLNPASVRKP